MANKWIEHVRAFALKKKISYMCAMTKPECKASYAKTKMPAKAKGRPAGAKNKKTMEMDAMAMEDKK